MADTPEGVPEFIVDAELVVAALGGWPGFHDAEIIRLELHRRGARAEMDVRLPASSHIVTFEFQGVQDLEFAGFNEQNAVWNVTFERAGNHIAVVIEPSYGISGHFNCAGIRVVDIRAESASVDSSGL